MNKVLKYEEFSTEWIKSIDLSISMNHLYNKKIVLFGTGFYSEMVFRYLKNNGMSVSYYCDNDVNKQGKYIHGVLVVSPYKLCKIEEKFIFITARHCVKEIKKQLEDMDLYSISFDNFILGDRYEEYKKIYENYLEDAKSKETYKNIMKCMATGENKYCQEVMEKDAFYSLPMFTNNGNDIFVDAGAFVGDTVEQFIWNNIGQFKKIYAFEPGERQFKAMKFRVERLIQEWGLENKKIECINAGLGESNNKVPYHINEDVPCGNNFLQESSNEFDKIVDIYSLDEYLDKKQVTFIKADIEGYELEMLKGSEYIIKQYKPKLAISIYHKPDDILEIITYLKKIVPEYKIAIRHHAPILVDTVLYCWIDK